MRLLCPYLSLSISRTMSPISQAQDVEFKKGNGRKGVETEQAHLKPKQKPGSRAVAQDSSEVDNLLTA